MGMTTDQDVFTRFRRALEDGVMYAINVRGKRVSASPGGCCPVGVMGPLMAPNPRPSYVQMNLVYPQGVREAQEDQLGAFMDGFDGRLTRNEPKDTHPFYELGKLYRKRFP